MMDLEEQYYNLRYFFAHNSSDERMEYFKNFVNTIKAEALQEAYNDGIAIPAEDE